MVMVMEGGEICWQWEEFLAGGIFSAFACGATTSSPMNKRRTRIDLACSKGAETTFLSVLIVEW